MPKRAGSAPKPAADVARAPKKLTRPPTAKIALAAIGIDAICLDLRSGKSLTRIAKDAGVGVARLLDWLAEDAERSMRARDARSAAAAMYDELAESGIQEATDPFELAKAKEVAYHLRWRASKVNPASYGDKVQVDASVLVRDISDELLIRKLARFGVELLDTTGSVSSTEKRLLTSADTTSSVHGRD